MIKLQNSLYDIEKNFFYFISSTSQKKLWSQYENEGYIYLTWGLKFSVLAPFKKEIADLGFDPEDFRELILQVDETVFRVFFCKPLKIQKEAFKVRRDPGAYLSRFLRKFKEEHWDMRSVRGEELGGWLKETKFPWAVVTQKQDGELSLLKFDGKKAEFYSRRGFIRQYEPLSSDIIKKLKKQKVKNLIALGELVGRDLERKLPYLPFAVTMDMIKKPSKEEEKNICWVGYELVILNDTNMILKLDLRERLKELKRLFGTREKEKYSFVTPFIIAKEPNDIQDAWDLWVEKEGGEGLAVFIPEDIKEAAITEDDYIFFRNNLLKIRPNLKNNRITSYFIDDTKNERINEIHTDRFLTIRELEYEINKAYQRNNDNIIELFAQRIAIGLPRGQYYKIKKRDTFDLAIIGIQMGTGKFIKTTGALLLSWLDPEKRFRFASRCGTGLTDEDRDYFWNFAIKNKADGPKKFAGLSNIIWVKPKIVVETIVHGVHFRNVPALVYKKGEYQETRELLPSVSLRMPSYKRIRHDKQIIPVDLRLEQVPGWEKRQEELLKEIKGVGMMNGFSKKAQEEIRAFLDELSAGFSTIFGSIGELVARAETLPEELKKSTIDDLRDALETLKRINRRIKDLLEEKLREERLKEERLEEVSSSKIKQEVVWL